MGSGAVLHLIHRTHSPAASDSKSVYVTSAGGADMLRRAASPVKRAHVDPCFLFTRSPESGDVPQGQPLALVSDLPRGDWWSDEHSARDLYIELPPTNNRSLTCKACLVNFSLVQGIDGFDIRLLGGLISSTNTAGDRR